MIEGTATRQRKGVQSVWRWLAAVALAAGCHSSAATPVRPESPGALVLSGGEFIHPEIRARFVALAGGPGKRFLYVPTASSGIRLETGFEYEPTGADTANARDVPFAQELGRVFGVEHMSLLHTRVRATANSEAFASRIREADGVWLSGGNAGRLADAYLGTRVETELRALLRRGGVIGGNSAGAIIQGAFIVRGRPDKPVLMAPGRTRGFAFLPDVAVNPHLLSQKRENELVSVLDAHPELLGIGIPDSAGIVVRDGVLEPVGDGRIAIYDNQRHGCCWYYFLTKTQRFDLRERRVRP
jgi:cyanophycinase